MVARRRKRNPDDEIRKLERTAFSTQASSDIAAYWRACIRARVSPKPTICDYNDPIWTLFPVEFRKPEYFPPYIYKIGNAGYLGAAGHWDSDLLILLSELIELQEKHPWKRRKKKKNSDDNIRALERRAAETRDSQDILAYWNAKLRAGELPTPISHGVRKPWTYWIWEVSCGNYEFRVDITVSQGSGYNIWTVSKRGIRPDWDKHWIVMEPGVGHSSVVPDEKAAIEETKFLLLQIINYCQTGTLDVSKEKEYKKMQLRHLKQLKQSGNW